MHIMKKLYLVPLLIFGLIQTAAAVQVSPYITSTFTTDSSNARTIPIADILDSSVVFEPGDNVSGFTNTELLSNGLVIFRVCPDPGQDIACVSSTDTASTPIPISQGTVNIEGSNVVFRPTDPTSTANVSFTYIVEAKESQTNQPSGESTITLLVEDVSVTRTNLISIEEAVSDFCINNPTNALIQSTCEIYNGLSQEDKENALKTISPEEVVAEFTSTLNMTKEQTGNLANRLNALRGGATGFSLSGLNYISGDDIFYGQWIHEMAEQVSGNAGGEESFSRLGLFINGSITDGEKDTTSLETGYDMDGDSITLGADYRFSDTMVAGIAYGMSETEISFTSNNEMNNETDNLLVYGSWYKDQFYIDGMVGYASGDIETKRRIAIGAINEVVGGKTESSQIFFSITGNYDFIEGAFTYGPFASLDYTDGEIDGYEEVGGT